MKLVLPLLLSLALLACNQRPYQSQRSEPRAVPAGTITSGGAILSYATVVSHVAPAVVTIRASLRVQNQQQFPFLDNPFFRQFFGGGMPRQPRSQMEQVLGSGVVVRADGYILTNHHVVDGAENIKVDLSNRRTYSAKVVGSDAPSDLAVLKIDAGGLSVLQLGDSDQVQVGDVCLAVGNPMGIGETVTSGIISAKGRSTETGTGSFQDFLQTDAAINKGNSGGALVNTRGDLIGINSQILSPNGGNIGIGFAIPSNMARGVMDQLLKKGTVQRGMMGVAIQQITPDLAAGLGLKDAQGVLVSGVTPGGPAEKAGLHAGDVILKLNGKDQNDSNALRNAVAAMSPGTDVTLTILRNGSQQDVHVRLEELTEQNAAAQPGQGGQSGGASKLGIQVIPLSPELASELGIQRGLQGVVVQSVDPSGPAGEAGIQEGDVILQVNRHSVRTPADVENMLAHSGSTPPLLLINRGGQTLFVAVPMR